MLFYLDKRRRKKSKKLLSSIENQLSNLDSEVAIEYLSWIDRKTSYLKKSFDKEGYGAQPDSLVRGDIIWVEFGINVGTELSDYKTKGHYALVWSVDLGNIVVIPLSSRDAPGSALTFDLGVIKELNDDNKNTHSFLKLDAIRSISKRRIGRMNGKENGKIHLPDNMIKKIKEYIKQSFLN